MDSIWPVVLTVVIVSGATAAHFGGIVLERFLPHFGKLTDGSPRAPDPGEVAALRTELEASQREVDRLRTLEDRVGRIQEQVQFLERLLEGESRGASGR